MKKRIRLLSLILAVLLHGVGCGDAKPPEPLRPVVVSLGWQGDADLDLLINGESAWRIGGSPDRTLGGGTEAYNFSPETAAESVVVGVANRSAEPGGSGVAEAVALISITDRTNRSITVEHTIRSESWAAFVVYPRSGDFAVLD